MIGDDVRSLQYKLGRLLGFAIPEDEMLDGYFGTGTRKAVIEFQRKFDSNVLNGGATGVVDDLTTGLITEQVNKLPDIEQSKQFIVRGAIRNEFGRPAPNLVVRAFDRDIRHEEPLGITKTDLGGRYEISYSSRQFVRAEKSSADLVVRVYKSEAPDETPMISSDIIFNSSPTMTMDLTIGGRQFVGISEYEEIINEITPLIEGLAWREITENDKTKDISFLTSETGLDREKIEFIVLANKSAEGIRLPAGALYAFYRHRLPTDIPSLLSRTIGEFRQVLEFSLDNNIIPPEIRRSLDDILERLRQLKIGYAFEEPSEKEIPSLGKLLISSIKLQDESQKKLLAEKFLNLYLKYKEESRPIQEFWKDLRESQPEFREHIQDLQLVLQFSAITHNHWPLIEKIQNMRDEGKVNSLQDLANLDVDDWITIINSRANDGSIIGCPKDIIGEGDEKVRKYAETITRIIQDSFPTTVFARRLEKHNLPANRDLIVFFRNNTTFDMRKDYLEKYLNDKPGSINGIENKDFFKAQLKRYQRIFKLTPNYNEMSVLLDDGLESAYAISKIGRNVFLKRYNKSLGSVQRAEKIYDDALRVSAMAMHVFSMLSPRINGVG